MTEDYSKLRDRVIGEYPQFDLNGDGVEDTIRQGTIDDKFCNDKVMEGCTQIKGIAASPVLVDTSDAFLSKKTEHIFNFSKGPKGLNLFGDATAFAFTKSASALRFFPDEAAQASNAGFGEGPASFAVGQNVGYFKKGTFVTFKIEGVAIGLEKKNDHMEPVFNADKGVRRIAYGSNDGKQIEKHLGDIIWATKDRQPIDPQVLVDGGSRTRTLSAAETSLLPLFDKARDISLQFRKEENETLGKRDVRAVKLQSKDIKEKAFVAMNEMFKTNCPPDFQKDTLLRDGLRMALGKTLGLSRKDMTEFIRKYS